MGEYKTPGVYIKEKNAFGNSVVEAETAIPAFIGYTEKAVNGNDSLTNVPWKISSMTEFIQYFGGAPELKFDVDIKRYYPEAKIDAAGEVTPAGAKVKPEAEWFQTDVDTKEEEEFNGKSYKVSYAFCMDGKNPYTLYYNLMLFFANGGGTCYIVSVGSYGDAISKDALIGGLEKLSLEQTITMVVIPEAVKLAEDDFKDVQQQMLSHCGYTMKNRFALLDIYPKANPNTRFESRIDTFWNNIGSSFLSYGAAYFPWLNTSVIGNKDLDGDMFTWRDNVCSFINRFPDSAFMEILKVFCLESEELEIKEDGAEGIESHGHIFKFQEVAEGYIYADKKRLGKIEKVEDITDKDGRVTSKKIKILWYLPLNEVKDKQAFHQALFSSSVLYQQAVKAILAKLNLLPPSAAMAGIYTMVDKSRGVWKAPANVTLNYVSSPAEDIDDDGQANLNAPMNGKAVNIIRTFRGEGVKVWGARTLDGNSLDWRYINVRRTMLFLEESVKNAARAYVFEPNDAGTWINMKCMIENFLRSVWKRGGLAGATPEDAYEVHVGLGDTMTGEDILEGIMRITVLVAISHPAEFIEITFQQQMQKS